MLKLFFENCLEGVYPSITEVDTSFPEALDEILDLDILTHEELIEFLGEDMAFVIGSFMEKDNEGNYMKLIGYELLTN